MDQKVCKHLHCKKKNNNTQCIRTKFSKIQNQNSGIGRETADLNDMFINRSTYLNNFNRQKKISVSDKDYVLQNRNQENNFDKQQGNIVQSEIVYDNSHIQSFQNKDQVKSQNFYKDDDRMFVYYQKPKESLKTFKANDKDVDVLMFLTLKLKKMQARNFLQFIQQYQQRYIIENQILKSHIMQESQIDDFKDQNYVSIKGVKIPQQNDKEKDEKIDYFDLQQSANSNEQDILQENQKFKNTLTNLNEELKQAKLSLKQNFSDQKKIQNQNEFSEIEDTSYFDQLDNQTQKDYSLIQRSKRNSEVSEIQNLNLQSYFDQQKEKEKGRRDRQRDLNKRRKSRQMVNQQYEQIQDQQIEEPQPSKRFSFIQNIQQGFERNKRLSDSGIVFQNQEKEIQQSETVDELDELLGNKKILSEEDEEFFMEFAPKKIDQQFQQQLNKSVDDLFSPKHYKGSDKFSDDDEDYFYKEHKENLFHETLDEHNFRVAGGQREINIDFDMQKQNLSLSEDENDNFQMPKNNIKQSGFIQSKRFTLGKLDDAIEQIRRDSLRSQQQILKQTIADEFIEETMNNVISRIKQEKQQQQNTNLEIAQKSILLSKIDERNQLILSKTAKKNSMKLIQNLILEKQNQMLAYNIMQQDTQHRNSLRINSETKENVSQNKKSQVQLTDILQNKVQKNQQQQVKDTNKIKEVKEQISKNNTSSDSDQSSSEDDYDIVNREMQTSINQQINQKLQEQFEENRRYSNMAKKSLIKLYSDGMKNIIDEEEKQEQKKEQKRKLSKFINEEYNIIQNSVRDIINTENLEQEKQRRVSQLIDQNLENVRKTILLQIDEEEQKRLDQLVDDNLQYVRTSVHQLIHQEIKDQQKAKKLDEEIDQKFDDIIEDEIQRQISNSVNENLEKQYEEKRRNSSCAKQRLSDIYEDSMQTYMEDIQKDEELEEFINRNLALTKSSVLEVIYEEEEDQKISDLVEDNLNLVRFSVQQIFDKEIKNEKKKKRLSKMVQDEVNQMYLKEIQKQVNTEIVKSMYEQDIEQRKSTLKKSQIDTQNLNFKKNDKNEVERETRQSLIDAAQKIKQILNLEISDHDQNRRISMMVDDNLEQIKKFSIKQNKKEEKERRRLSTMVSQNLDNIVNREIQKSINTQIQLDMLKQAEEERRNSLIAKKTLKEIVNKEIQKQINQEIINSMTQQELQEYEMDEIINQNLESLKDIQIRKTINEGQLKHDIQEEIESQKIPVKQKKRLSVMIDENFEDLVRKSIRHTLKQQRCSLEEVKNVKDENLQLKNFNTQRNSLADESQQSKIGSEKKMQKKKAIKRRSSFIKKDFQYEIIDDQINQIPKEIIEEIQEPIYRRKTTIPEDRFVARQSSFINNHFDMPLIRPKLNSVVVTKKQTLVKSNYNNNETSIRPKMNSIIMNKKSIHNNLLIKENESFVRPKLNSIVMRKCSNIQDNFQDEQRVRPKMNSIVMHKKSTIVRRPIIEENEVFIRPKLNSFVMKQQPTIRSQSIIEDNKVRPKMNSIVIHKRSTVVQRPFMQDEEAFVRPKLNSLVMNQRPTLTRQSVSQEMERVRPKMNSIVMHKKSTVLQRPIIEENEVFVRPKLNSLVINQQPQYIESKQTLKENEQNEKPKLNSLLMPKKSVLSNNSESVEKLRNSSNSNNIRVTLRNMTNYKIQPIEEEEQDNEFINQKLCSRNLRKLTKKLINEQKLEMKNAMIDYMLDKPRKETKNKRQSIQFDQFLKRNSKFDNIRFSANPLFNIDSQNKIQEEPEQKSLKSLTSSSKKNSVFEEGNLQVQILSINNISKLIDKSVEKMNDEINFKQKKDFKTQLVTVDTMENLDGIQQQKIQNEENLFQSFEFPYQDVKPQPQKQSINIKASGFDNEEIIEDENSISWINKNSVPQKNNTLSTSSNQRMSTKVMKKSPTEYEMQSVLMENLEDQNINRKTTLDNRSKNQSEILTKQNSIGDLDDQEEINELVVKKITRENSKTNLFKKNQRNFENYSFHSVIFREEHSPEFGTNPFKSQLQVNKKNQKRNTVENIGKWKDYIQDYNMKMMDKMNKAFNKNQDAKQSAILLDELMSQKIDYEYLIFCLNIDKDQVDKIKKFQKFYRQRLHKKILKKIKEGQDIFKRETNLIHVRKTNLF